MFNKLKEKLKAWISKSKEKVEKTTISREDTSEHFELSNKDKTKTQDASKKPLGVLDKAIIIGPSHYAYLIETVTSNKQEWQTPLGKIRLFNTNFPSANIDQEHSITNQIPFLQKLNIKQIMPLMIGEITNEQAKQIAEKISKISASYIFSTDLSHFLPYEQALKKDKQTIHIIENLDLKNTSKLDACGIYPLLVLFHLCKLKNWNPKLIQYKNSGDITGDKGQVVGYASFFF